MNSADDKTTSTPSNRPLQFSLRTLLLVVAGASVGLAVVVSLPGAVAAPVLMCLSLVIPAVLTVVLVCGTRYQRAFCMAALFPIGAVAFATLWVITVTLFNTPGNRLSESSDWLEFFNDVYGPYRVYSAAAWLLGVAVGCLGVWIRWHLDRSGSRQE
jgi:hypothetical protein